MCSGSALATMPASLWMARVGRRTGFMAGALVNIGGCALARARAAAAELRAVLRGDGGHRHLQRDRAAVPVRGSGSRVAGRPREGDLAGARGRHRRRVPRPGDDALGPRPLRRRRSSARSCCSPGGRWSRWPCNRACTSRRRRSRSAPAAAAARAIVRQPVFIVAALSGALSYGLMNLLMVATPLAMELLRAPVSRRPRW